MKEARSADKGWLGGASPHGLRAFTGTGFGVISVHYRQENAGNSKLIGLAA